MTEALEGLRREISSRLPEWISQALAVYRGFAEDRPPADAKGFAAHQAACRAALGHVDALLRLARWASAAGEGGAAAGDDLDRLAAEARAALARYGGAA